MNAYWYAPTTLRGSIGWTFIVAPIATNQWFATYNMTTHAHAEPTFANVPNAKTTVMNDDMVGHDP